MATEHAGVLRSIRTLFRVGPVGGLTDAQLLERFVDQHGEAAELAFEALVVRHGPMVLRVCRHVLRDPHDVADAFQATFLVLMRHAGSIRQRNSVASWLYGVAHRVASRARADLARRHAHECRAAAMAPEAYLPDDDRNDVRSLLHEEIDRLPEKYRAPIVLCYLENLTHEAAAHHLGWPVGTVRGRLARARDVLRTRLTRRGSVFSTAAFIAFMTQRSAFAAVPPRLLDATVQAATRLVEHKMAAGALTASVAALMEGVGKTMFLAKLRRMAAAGLAVGLIATATALCAQHSAEPEQRAQQLEPEQSPAPEQNLKSVVRTYAVGDLIVMPTPLPGSHPVPDMEPLVELINATVAPGSWKERDSKGHFHKESAGIGSITPFLLNQSLIVRHTDEVHTQVAERLRQLRRLSLVASANGSQGATPAGPGPKAESVLERRLVDVERKLDEILKALEESNRNHQRAPSPEP